MRLYVFRIGSFLGGGVILFSRGDLFLFLYFILFCILISGRGGAPPAPCGRSAPHVRPFQCNPEMQPKNATRNTAPHASPKFADACMFVSGWCFVLVFSRGACFSTFVFFSFLIFKDGPARCTATPTGAKKPGQLHILQGSKMQFAPERKLAGGLQFALGLQLALEMHAIRPGVTAAIRP